MLAYGILDESEELVLMTIEALIQLAAGNAGVNVANVGIASFAILTAVAYPIANSRWAVSFIPILALIKQLMRNRLMQLMAPWCINYVRFFNFWPLTTEIDRYTKFTTVATLTIR